MLDIKINKHRASERSYDNKEVLNDQGECRYQVSSLTLRIPALSVLNNKLYPLLWSRLFVWVFVYLRGGGGVGRGEFGNVLTGKLRPNTNLIALYLVYLFGQLIQCTLSLYLPFENGTPFTYLLKKTEFTYNLCRHNVRLAHWFHHTRFRRTGERVRCMICCVFCSSNHMFGMKLIMDDTGT